MSSNIVPPLWSRKLDLLYLIFFATHIPATLLVDLQALAPQPYLPSLIQWYVDMSGDPLMKGVLEGKANSELVWFRTFVCLELFFQLPVFVIGIRGLWNASKSIYILLLIYGASTATTTLPCIVYFLSKADELRSDQLIMLVSSYVPYFLIPLGMMIDMAVYRLPRQLRVKEE